MNDIKVSLAVDEVGPLKNGAMLVTELGFVWSVAVGILCQSTWNKVPLADQVCVCVFPTASEVKVIPARPTDG